MKYTLSFFFMLVWACFSYAQRSDRTEPLSFALGNISTEIPVLAIARPDQQIAERQALSSFDKVYDFGVAVPFRYNLLESGIKEPLADGKWLVRSLIQADGAYGINLNFYSFFPGNSGKLWIYSEDRTQYLGAFDRNSVTPGISFATAPVKGERIVLEFVYDPSEENIAVELAQVVYEFADIFEVSRAFGSSGACNRNVNCPEYASKADQKRSVAMILTENNVRWCSGTLVNNTAQDGKPYFLTARHCNTTANSIFVFNYESPDCNNIDGSTAQSIQGCSIRVNWASSDVTLVELSSVPPQSYFTYFSGWNASNTAADSVFGIHHPKGDIKKISFDRNAVVGAPYYSSDTALNHWKILTWEVGTTEQGSSGSPLFNPDNQVVGQLHGGQANCSNSVNDYYGKFAYSWFGENTPETALKFWLDPLNSAAMELDGASFNVPDYNYDLALTGLAGPDSMYCSQSANWVATVRNNGVMTIQSYRISLWNNGEIIASEEIGEALPYGSTKNITFSNVAVEPGENTFLARVEILAISDENMSNDTATKVINQIFGEDVRVDFQYDLFSSETKWGIYGLDGSPVYLSSPAAAHEFTSNTFCLPAGCYLFRVTDNGDDGICCSGGEGAFSVTGSQNELLVENATFTDLYEKKFCVPGLPTSWDELFQLYPNPTNSLLNVKVQSYAEGFDSELTISTVDGKVLVNQTGSLKYLNTFDVSEWANGIYFVRLKVGKVKSVQKFIKN